RDRCSLPLGEGEELRGQIARDIAVERHRVRDPEAVEDGEHQQGVLGALSQRFSLLDQNMCLFRSRLGFRRGEPLDVPERGYQRDLKLDLLTPHRGRRGQGPRSGKRTSELLNGFDERRARQRTQARFSPQVCSLLGQTGLGAVTRQQLWLTFGNLRKLAL